MWRLAACDLDTWPLAGGFGPRGGAGAEAAIGMVWARFAEDFRGPTDSQMRAVWQPKMLTKSRRERTNGLLEVWVNGVFKHGLNFAAEPRYHVREIFSNIDLVGGGPWCCGSGPC